MTQRLPLLDKAFGGKQANQMNQLKVIHTNMYALHMLAKGRASHLLDIPLHVYDFFIYAIIP